MKNIYLVITITLIAIPGFSQIIKTVAGKIDLKKAYHYGGYLQNKKVPADHTKIIWYPDFKLYRICGKYDKVQAVPSGYTYVDDDCNCAEAFPYQINLAAEAKPIDFYYNSASIKPSTYATLEIKAKDLKASGRTITLEGYASAEGTAAHAMKLSRDRAMSVKTYLVNAGVDAKQLKLKAYGESHPINDNSTEDGRQANRRVEFKELGSVQ